jgi:hypothetical protein
MERTESLVVQVTPSYENAKIHQMEHFYWSLQGRQEIHEKGDAEGAPSIFGDAYIIKTKVSHYVKLHFVRPLSTPHLDRIKPIEAEYFSLPFPGGPSLKWPIGLGVYSLLSGIIGKGDVRVVSAVVLALCIFWAYRVVQKRNSARSTCEASLARQQELLEQLRGLQ